MTKSRVQHTYVKIGGSENDHDTTMENSERRHSDETSNDDVCEFFSKFSFFESVERQRIRIGKRTIAILLTTRRNVECHSAAIFFSRYGSGWVWSESIFNLNVYGRFARY